MLTFLILKILILAWELLYMQAEGLSSVLLLSRPYLSWLQAATRDWAEVLSLWVPFSSPTSNRWIISYAQLLIISIRWSYAGLAYVLIFAMISPDLVCGVDLMHLVLPARKTEDRAQLERVSSAVVITSWSVQMGFDCSSTVPHGFHPK